MPTVDVEPQSVTEKLGPSLVTVDFGRPFPINGITSEQFRGTGVVVDTERGLVVTDRMTVTQSPSVGVHKVSSLLPGSFESGQCCDYFRQLSNGEEGPLSVLSMPLHSHQANT